MKRILILLFSISISFNICFAESKGYYERYYSNYDNGLCDKSETSQRSIKLLTLLGVAVCYIGMSNLKFEGTIRTPIGFSCIIASIYIFNKSSKVNRR